MRYFGAHSTRSGFVLPTTILLSLATMVIAVSALSGIVASSASLNNQYYQSLAAEAAQAGLIQANACMDSGATTFSSLNPGQNCAGSIDGSPATILEQDNWKSTYAVVKTANSIKSTGSLTVYSQTNAVVSSFTKVYKTDLSTSATYSTPATSKAVTDVATGADYTCAITAGKVYCWGRNNFGQLGNGNNSDSLTPVPVKADNPSDALFGKTVTSVVAAATHTCALAEGNVYCWGENFNGGVGDLTYNNTNVPKRAIGALNNKTVTKISVGTNASNMSCAITNETSSPTPNTAVNAYCWGGNVSGQLGTNSIGGSANQPLRVTDASNVLAGRQLIDIGSGNNHTCGLTADGQVICWGDNDALNTCNMSNFGTGMTCSNVRPTPFQAIAQTNFGSQPVTKLGIGSFTNCAIAGGKEYCWANNSQGQLGNGTNTTNSTIPKVTVTTTNGIPNAGATDIDTDSDTSCSVRVGQAYCWGSNSVGQLGIGVTGSYSTTPYFVSTLQGKTVTKVASGYRHECAIADDGLYCWGANDFGKLGNGNTTASNVPIRSSLNASDPNVATAIAAGVNHTCGIIGGYVYCWGDNSTGQLGSTTSGVQTTPLLIPGQNGLTMTMVTSGDGFSCAVATTNDVYCWGKDDFGQLGDGMPVGGYRNYPAVVTGIPANTAITSISAGARHVCVSTVNGSNTNAYCWGDNAARQLAATTPTYSATAKLFTGSAIKQIGAGGVYGCAITTDVFLYCWGTNNDGVIGNNGTLGTAYASTKITAGAAGSNKFNAVTTGTNFGCALVQSSSQNICWGLGTSLQLGNGTATTSRIPVLANNGALAGVTISSTSAGDNHACSVAIDHSVICWGAGGNNRIGNNSTASTNPVKINTLGALALKTATTVSAGAAHTCAIADGLIVCWGLNTSGQLGLGNAAPNTAPAQITTYQTSTSGGQTADSVAY